MNNEEAITRMETLADILKPPYQLLEHVLHGTYSFSMGHYPHEVITEDDPPLKVAERTEIIPIDEFLGNYSPDKQEIIIFKKGIQEASNILQVNTRHLEIIVRIHEWAHALFHLGVTNVDRLSILKDDSYWLTVLDASTKLFNEIERGLHELLAQIVTLYCVQNLKENSKTEQGKQILEKVEHTFHLLSSHQPPEYHIHDLLNVPMDRFRKSIDLLRNRWLVGKVEPWKTTITW